MSSIKLLPICALLLGFQECDQQQRPQPPPKPTYQQRFIPIHREPQNVEGVPWSGAFALDTKTGQLCETYELSNDKWAAIPRCYDLYRNFPD
jgi:hypothetical protein